MHGQRVNLEFQIGLVRVPELRSAVSKVTIKGDSTGSSLDVANFSSHQQQAGE